MIYTSCRHCGQELKLSDAQDRAWHPQTKKPAKWNYYGGWVCNDNCDKHACYNHEASMPGNKMPPFHEYQLRHQKR